MIAFSSVNTRHGCNVLRIILLELFYVRIAVPSAAALIYDLQWLRINERIQCKLGSITFNAIKLDNLLIYLNFYIFMFLRVLYDLNLISCLISPFVS